MATVSTTTGTYLENLFNPQVVADLIDSKLIDNIVFAPPGPDRHHPPGPRRQRGRRRMACCRRSRRMCSPRAPRGPWRRCRRRERSRGQAPWRPPHYSVVPRFAPNQTALFYVKRAIAQSGWVDAANFHLTPFRTVVYRECQHAFQCHPTPWPLATFVLLEEQFAWK